MNQVVPSAVYWVRSWAKEKLPETWKLSALQSCEGAQGPEASPWQEWTCMSPRWISVAPMDWT